MIQGQLQIVKTTGVDKPQQSYDSQKGVSGRVAGEEQLWKDMAKTAQECLGPWEQTWGYRPGSPRASVCCHSGTGPMVIFTSTGAPLAWPGRYEERLDLHRIIK